MLGIKAHDNEPVQFEQEVGFQLHGRTQMDAWFAEIVFRTREALEASLLATTQREHEHHTRHVDGDVSECAQISVLVAKVFLSCVYV